QPGGLVQYQPFVPADRAAEVFANILRACQRAGLPSYLGVTKRHRPDSFLLSHAVDGFSFALDFAVTRRNRPRLWDLLHGLDELVLGAGGRFYFAKDLTLTSDRVPRIWPAAALAEFARLKHRWDPEGLLASDLMRRLELPSGPGGSATDSQDPRS
ncbi:MAG TPA: hypothetical protein VEI97_05070, partial [bacterium]|nr:hypothetical protein [bacterium]